jgi:diaminopimelate decarboxylase
MSLPERQLPVHAPMNQFPVHDGELAVGGERLSTLAARVGQTPFYAYDRTLLRSRVAELRAALPHGIKLHYAMKANPMPAVVAFMAGLVDGIDVASAGELKVALDAGANAQEVSFAGPGKRDAELRQAVASKVLVNVESFREVPVLQAISRELGLPARVAVRVNPDFELKGSGMKMGGGPKQFGVDVEQMPELLAAIGAAGLVFEGFHLFAGSQNLRADSICEAQQKSYELAVRLAAHAPAPVKFLNLGGGFGIPYFPLPNAQVRPSIFCCAYGTPVMVHGKPTTPKCPVASCHMIKDRVRLGHQTDQTFDHPQPGLRKTSPKTVKMPHGAHPSGCQSARPAGPRPSTPQGKEPIAHPLSLYLPPTIA